jgi:hypothetical protein
VHVAECSKHVIVVHFQGLFELLTSPLLIIYRLFALNFNNLQAMAKRRNSGGKASAAHSAAPSSRKRTRSQDTTANQRNVRQASPSKGGHVSWAPRLVSDATPSQANHRQQSPARSAMHVRVEDVEDEDYGASDPYSAQIMEIHDDDDERVDGDLGDDLDCEPVYQAFGSRDLRRTQDPYYLGCEDEDDDDTAPSRTYHPGDDIGVSYTGLSNSLDNMGVGGNTSSRSSRTRGPELTVRASTEPSTERPKTSTAYPPFSQLPVFDSGSFGNVPAEKKDQLVCKWFYDLRDRVDDYASKIYGPPWNVDLRKVDCVRQLLDDEDSAQTVRYIGCLAIGGPKGRQSWNEMLKDQQCRHALIVGMIGRALKEHVFSSLWFGGTEHQLEELSQIEQDSLNTDGELLSMSEVAYVDREILKLTCHTT